MVSLVCYGAWEKIQDVENGQDDYCMENGHVDCVRESAESESSGIHNKIGGRASLPSGKGRLAMLTV
jgi:hypothetical protein